MQPGLLPRRSPLVRRHPPVPGPPWSNEYVRCQRQFVADALASAELIESFRLARPLPRGYGAGFDERVIEYPWAAATGPRGRTLDAGASLNHRHVLDALLASLDSLTIVTAAPEEPSFAELGVSYETGDLRRLAFGDASFDTVVCISTLEHVGMDNSLYGVAEPPAEDPGAETLRALGELRRVTRPGGRLLVTVPYGEPTDHGWFRQFDQGEIERLIHTVSPASSRLDVFRYSRRGWRRSDPRRAAGARYRDHRADPSPARDRAPAARAVACLEMAL